VAEWSNAAVSKTVKPARASRVRISPSPQIYRVVQSLPAPFKAEPAPFKAEPLNKHNAPKRTCMKSHAHFNHGAWDFLQIQ
jgi:hypothetical protein